MQRDSQEEREQEKKQSKHDVKANRSQNRSGKRKSNKIRFKAKSLRRTIFSHGGSLFAEIRSISAQAPDNNPKNLSGISQDKKCNKKQKEREKSIKEVNCRSSWICALLVPGYFRLNQKTNGQVSWQMAFVE
jgi:hypothetical protein